jgi:hypothetical protein
VEIPIHNTSTERSLIWAPFDKISKSGDGGGSGGCLGTIGGKVINFLEQQKTLEVVKRIYEEIDSFPMEWTTILSTKDWPRAR